VLAGEFRGAHDEDVFGNVRLEGRVMPGESEEEVLAFIAVEIMSEWL
jgi:hypothetical protein